MSNWVQAPVGPTRLINLSRVWRITLEGRVIRFSVDPHMETLWNCDSEEDAERVYRELAFNVHARRIPD